MNALKYISHYPENLQEQVQQLIDNKKLTSYLKGKYPNENSVKTDKALYSYIQDIKNVYIKKSQPLSKITFDNKINVIQNALGMHTFISRVQGNKLKAKNEIRISSIFKNAPEEFLEMIVVHELAHLKEKEHNKAFYKLCMHMSNNYSQLEFDTRIYLIHLDLYGKIYK